MRPAKVVLIRANACKRLPLSLLVSGFSNGLIGSGLGWEENAGRKRLLRQERGCEVSLR